MRILLTFLALIASTNSQSQVVPLLGEGDPRLQTVRYNVQQVVTLVIPANHQLLVTIAPGEQIETVGLGDSAPWQVTVGKRGDFFFIKNVQAASNTNLTIITDARVYHFELKQGDSYGETPPYRVQFTYDEPTATKDVTDSKDTANFTIWGPKSIKPSKIYQSSTHTFIEWLPSQALPATFAEADGEETLVNGEMQNGRYVIVGTPEKLIFRADKKIARAKRIKRKFK
jgi:type IV secretion system protein VirB9